jgi:hypothetical protein
MVTTARGKLYLARMIQKTAIVFVLTGLISGCGSPKMAPIPSKTIAEFDCRTSSEGLEVAVDAWTDCSRVKKHFGMNLLASRIVPFEIAFANVGADGGYFLQPQSVIILDDKGIEEIRSARGHLDPTLTLMPSIFFYVTPALALGHAIIVAEPYRDEQDVKHQMNSMQFIDRPLYRSDSNKGFIYLKFGDIADLQKIAGIKFRAKNVGSRQEKTLIVSLKGR